MPWPEMFIAGTGTCLPDTTAVPDAVAAGAYDAEEALESEYLCITTGGAEDYPADFAVGAARSALALSNHQPTDVSLLLYSVGFSSGPLVANAAAHVQRRLEARSAVPLELRGLSNGLISLPLVCAWLTSQPKGAVALLVGGDRWHLPRFDRWRANRGLVFGDGGGALVLSHERGFGRIVNVATVADAELEGLHRGAAQDDDGRLIDLAQRAAEFRRERGEQWHRRHAGIRAALDNVLRPSALTVADVSQFVVPFFGTRLLHREVLEPLDIPPHALIAGLGHKIGHLGPADNFVGYDHLIRAGQVSPGDWTVLLAVGAGFTWTAVLLQAVTATR
ncbi:MAG: 3-oxoacyl-[acyl-carrier-protein] synthase III C-terminal domain-containing protein [Solirubrobacteraceae bacterium]